jgi:hypothetical protein
MQGLFEYVTSKWGGIRDGMEQIESVLTVRGCIRIVIELYVVDIEWKCLRLN